MALAVPHVLKFLPVALAATGARQLRQNLARYVTKHLVKRVGIDVVPLVLVPAQSQHLVIPDETTAEGSGFGTKSSQRLREL